MSFEVIRGFLLDNLIPALAPSVRAIAKEWVDQLGPADDSDVLGCCIAIDLRCESLRPRAFDVVFSELSNPFDSPRAAFAEALSRVPKQMVAASDHRAGHGSNGHERYASVLDLTAFLQEYVLPTYSHLTADDLDRARVEFFDDGSEPRELNEIEGPFQNPAGQVWVGSDADYRQCSQELGPQAATVLHDSLGLSDCWRGEMVYVQYPEAFEPPNCRQPASLDRSWSPGDGYLSAEDDNGWGWTHSRTNKGQSMRERVHGPLPTLGVEFTARLLGEPLIRPRDSARLRQTAVSRASTDPSDKGTHERSAT